jgi:predicted secreted hydrolase
MNSTTSQATEDPGQLLRAQECHESEWWYYHGYLSADARWFSFHLAFFRFRVDGIRLSGFVPLTLAGDQYRVAHFAVTEIDTRRFHYGFKRSLRGVAGASAAEFSTWVGDWRAHETGAGHHLFAAIRPARFDLEVVPLKPAVWRPAPTGVGSATRSGAGEICFTRMRASGELTVADERFNVQGEAWMDREFGDFPLKHAVEGWEWIAIQFEDGTELRVYQRRRQAPMPVLASLAFIDEAGTILWLGAGDYSLGGEGRWISPRTGIEYPAR